MSSSRSSDANRDSLRAALVLVLGTAVYNAAEAVVALWAGIEADSVALFGFGLDSIIECAAAGVLLWRLALEKRGADESRIKGAERRAQRLIGVTFFALAAYVIAQAAMTLRQAKPPEASVVGILLAVLSLMVMPAVSWAKIRLARRIGSTALYAEAKETLACSYLSLALLLGLGANAVAGWWWADPVAALLMVPWLIREGLEGIRGEPCCGEGESER